MKRDPLARAAVIILALAFAISLINPLQSVTAPASHHSALIPAVSTVRLLGGSSAATQCQTYGTGCARMLVNEWNAERATYGTAPLALNWTMGHGTSTCIGAAGHARHMAAAGFISHDQFPADICFPGWMAAEENVGQGWGSKYQAVQQVQALMAAEPIGVGVEDHHTNWLSGSVRQVGIGFAQSGNYWFISQEFAG